MNPSISMACNAVFGAGSENFGTVTGNVTFQDASANSGTVTGNAIFEGTAENKAGATINGNATFDVTAVNNGTVTGIVTIEGAEEAAYATWLAANTGVNQYSGLGAKNGQWAYNSTEYPSNMSAYAAQFDAQYPAWLASNVGVNQYGGTIGTYANQWAYYSTEYADQSAANLAAGAEETAYQDWLAGNTGVNQYIAGQSHYGQWAYNSTEYASQSLAMSAETETVKAAHDESAYQNWLASNSGVSQFSAYGNLHNGKWAYNSTGYASQAEAQAAYDAANPQ